MDLKTSAETFTLDRLLRLWPEPSQLRGAVLFGSRARENGDEIPEESDWDIGIIYEGPLPLMETPDCWDLFLWEKEHWERGFVLQLELARNSLILHDPDQIISERFQFLKDKILPHYVRYLRRI